MAKVMVDFCIEKMKVVELAVYQVTRRNTIDLFYANGKYFDLNISVRESTGAAKTKGGS